MVGEVWGSGASDGAWVVTRRRGGCAGGEVLGLFGGEVGLAWISLGFHLFDCVALVGGDVKKVE